MMPRPGDTFERYTIEDLIGEGGMGCVYRAYDPRLERRVALKVIAQDAMPATANVRLLREARAAAALDHPNAVAIFDVGECEGAPYIVMELVLGRTLRRAPGEVAQPVSTCIAQLVDVARALGAAHKRGLVHRDVKPENVMVRDDGVVKVLDFGIARRTDVDPGSATQPACRRSLSTALNLGRLCTWHPNRSGVTSSTGAPTSLHGGCWRMSFWWASFPGAVPTTLWP